MDAEDKEETPYYSLAVETQSLAINVKNIENISASLASSPSLVLVPGVNSVVPAVNSIVVPNIQSNVQYLVTAEAEINENQNKDQTLNSAVTEIISGPEMPGVVNKGFLDHLPVKQTKVENLQSVNSKKSDIFSVRHISSPTEFLSIQDYSSDENPTLKKDIFSGIIPISLKRTNSHEVNLDHFCDSPLIDSNKDVALMAEHETQVLDDITPKTASFDERTEISHGLFTTLTEQTLPENVNISKNSAEILSSHHLMKVSSECKSDLTENSAKEENCTMVFKSTQQLETESLTLKDKIIVLQCSDAKIGNLPITSCEIYHENKNLTDSSNIELVSKQEGNDKIIMTSSSLSEETAQMRIVYYEPESFLQTASSVCNSVVVGNNSIKFQDVSELSEETIFPQELSFRSMDVGILSMIPLDSVVVGNIALLPQSKTPIKFQVVQEDGSMKCVNVKPVYNAEDIDTHSVSEIGDQDAKDAATTDGAAILAQVVASDMQRPFKCELCSATFNRLGNYTRHKKIHTVPTKEDSRFQCEVCRKKFIQRCDMARHMHVHNGTEPHRCSVCGKGYLRHSDLLTHQRFHNREKPFACPQCAKGFSQKGDLNRHLRSIHLHMKPLTCGHCHKKFAKEATLIRHMQVSHRDIILESVTTSHMEKEHFLEVEEENISVISISS